VETYDEQERCKMSLVHYGVGNISENDIELAAMFDGELNSFAMIKWC
jgi:translation initiation factor IF-2